MAEPVPAADQTFAANSGETVAVPGPAAPGEPDPRPSRDDQVGDDPTPDRQSWGATWRKAGALFMAGLAVAAAIVLAVWFLTSKPSRPAPAKLGAGPSTTAAAASATATAAPSIASTPEQDGQYVKALNDAGIFVANPEAAVYNGKVVCDDLRQGMTVPQIVAAFRSSNPALGADADAFVTVSVHSYCPQNDNLVGAGS
ncbi:MAG: DUF732 domain-containing protein [Mycobacterium sp.]|nr:DUF732 domain-containing protein [Mycobacterium sp.]